MRLRPALGSPASDQITTACQSSAQRLTIGGAVRPLFVVHFRTTYPCGPTRCPDYLPPRKTPHGRGCGLPGRTLQGRCYVGFTPLRRLPAAILRPQAAEPHEMWSAISDFKEKILIGDRGVLKSQEISKTPRSTSFPRKRESMGAAKRDPSMDSRFRGSDAVFGKRF